MDHTHIRQAAQKSNSLEALLVKREDYPEGANPYKKIGSGIQGGVYEG